ncbi:MAG: triple tyrosine motif-containing protein [Marinoscillum sp.]
MSLRLIAPLLFFAYIISGSAVAQLEGTFRSITVDDGLAQNTVWDMLQDSSGYYWFATADGINRYDGQDFVHYKRVAGQSMTISGNMVWKLFLDNESRVWALHNEGVSVYNRNTDQFDKHFDARILGETNQGLWLLKGDSIELLDVNSLEHISSVFIERAKVKTHPLTSGQLLHQGIFYLTGKGGVEIFNTTTQKLNVLNTPSDYGGVFLLMNDSTIFCPGVASYMLNINTGEFIPITSAMRFSTDFYPTDVQWYNGQILVSSAMGLYIIDPKTMKALAHLESFDANTEMGYKFVQCIFADQNNVLFLGTNGNGLKVYSPFTNRFPQYSTGKAPLDMVKSISLLPNGTVLSGVYDHGLVIYKNQKSYRQVKFYGRSSGNSILGMTPFDEKNILAIQAKNLLRFNIETLKTEAIIEDLDEVNIPYPQFEKVENGWYFNTNSSILKVSSSLKIDTALVVSGVDYITSFALHGGKFFVGTNNSLFLFDSAGNQLKKPLQVYMKSITISNDRVYAASQSGLFELTLDGDLIRKHDVSTGLANDFVYGILEDDLGYIWISHNKGLSRIDPVTNEYLQFDVSDGLQSNEFNTGAFYKHTDGKLYFGGVSGVNVIDPNNLILNERPPQISLNSISLFDQPLEMDTTVNEKRLLVLDFTQNTLSFDFAAPDFTQPNSCRYAYKMQGLDDKWIESGSRHYARYANLPAGNYSFQMKAANGDGVWMEQPKTIQIIIVPPYWQKAWFKVLMVLLGLLIIIGILLLILARQKIKLQRKLEIKHKLELERVRISRDLHDNVGAQLSFLITNMEWIADHPESLDTDERRNQLKQLSDTGRQAITTLRQTIWAISQNELSVEDFADRFKQFAMKLVEFRPDIKLHFQENIQENTLLSPEVALNLFRIAQEAFNNAIRHSYATDYHITFCSSEEEPFGFELKDNGMGFDTSQPGPVGHFGLINMKSRAMETNASLLLDSKVGGGTSVSLLWTGELNNAFAV